MEGENMEEKDISNIYPKNLKLEKDSKAFSSYNFIVRKNPVFGLLLSYGTGEDIIPAGLFCMNRYVDVNGKPIKNYDELEDTSVYAEFIEFGTKKEDAILNEDNENKIFIPFDEYKNLAIKYNILKNSSIEESEKVIHNLDCGGEDLQKLNASYVSSNGEARATNYRIFPFEVNEVMTILSSYDIDELNSNPNLIYDIIINKYNKNDSKQI